MELEIAARQLSTVDLRPSLTVEADIPLRWMQGSTYSLITRLAPFGRGNPEPVFLSRGARVIGCQRIGSGSRHLRLKLGDGEVVWKAVGFDFGHLAGEVTPQIDVVYNLVVDRTPRTGFLARSTPELILRRLAETSEGEEKGVYLGLLEKMRE